MSIYDSLKMFVISKVPNYTRKSAVDKTVQQMFRLWSGMWNAYLILLYKVTLCQKSMI